MSSAKHAPTQPTDDRTSSAKTPALLHRLRGDSIGELLLNIGFFLSVVLCGALLVIYSLQLGANAVNLDVKTTVFVAFLLGLLAVDAAGCVAMIVFDYNTHLPQARMTARVTMVSLAATVVVGIAVTGLKPINLIYIFQFFCLIAFQSFTDEKLARNAEFHAPWDKSDDQERREYIPLNFFNIFWVFVIASIVGLIVEVLYHALVFGGYQDRAGLLWGPFSPIYGFGAVLMTIALNRYWNKSGIVIFLVAGLIGAAFEFFVSYFMETAFGVVAWDYSGTFLNIQGRTNFAFFCAWGLLGFMWIRHILPIVLNAVDAIPLKLRAALTVAFALFMIADGVMTLVTMDCWYKREAGQTPTTAVDIFCAEHYDDAYMANRFQSMSMDPSRTSRMD